MRQYLNKSKSLAQGAFAGLILFITSYLIAYTSQNYLLHTQKIRSLNSEIEHYYYNGWHVENIKTEFDEQYQKYPIGAFLWQPFSTKSIKSYRSKLQYEIANDKNEILEQILHERRESSKFYITEIAQDTTQLDNLFKSSINELSTENYYQMTSNLTLIHSEIVKLEQHQAQDIENMTNTMISTIESISFVAPYYRVQLNKPILKAQKVINLVTDPFQTYTDLKEFSDSLAEKLDSAIITRGGTTTNGKRILIVIGKQHLYMIENHNIIYDMPASTGISGHGTAVGEFQVYEKVPMAWGYYEIWMPYWLTIYYSGGLENGIHGIPISPAGNRWAHWDNIVGVSPVTYGCIMPHDWDAEILYNWADVGIPVSIVY